MRIRTHQMDQIETEMGAVLHLQPRVGRAPGDVPFELLQAVAVFRFQIYSQLKSNLKSCFARENVLSFFFSENHPLVQVVRRLQANRATDLVEVRLLVEQAEQRQEETAVRDHQVAVQVTCGGEVKFEGGEWSEVRRGRRNS